MAEGDALNGSGFPIKGGEVPQSLWLETSVEHTDQKGGGSTAPFTQSASVSVAAASHTAEKTKKKRGRPRKYGADGSIIALSPMPISASVPLSGEYSSWQSSFKKKHKLDFEGSGGRMAYPAGGGLMPHILTVNSGEDIMKKTISFAQQGYRAICILAANGSISNATLRQPNSSGGTVTYEGLFDILSLTGLFLPNDDGVTKSRTGGMSVLLAGPDGRVLGEDSQVAIGSFIPRDQHQQKLEKPNYERTISFASPNSSDFVESEERFDLLYCVTDPNLNSSSPFPGGNPARINPEPVFKNIHLENNASLPAQTPREQNHEITC